MKKHKTIRKGSNVLLVIAHPDDEAMFFSPLLINLRQNLCKVSLLCLSTGNFDGLGSKRSEEILYSADHYDISREKVKVIDHERLQDGACNNWSPELIKSILLESFSNEDFDFVSTT